MRVDKKVMTAMKKANELQMLSWMISDEGI